MGILRARDSEWRQSLLVVPYNTGEIKQLVEDCRLDDEQKVLAQLATLGSQSAAIVRRLQLTRKVLVEATQILRGERRAQSNLLAVIGATRYKMVTKHGLVDTCCPLRHCRQKNSFEHMPKCYDLESSVEHGAMAVQFLVKMARKTQIVDEHAPRIFKAQQTEAQRANKGMAI